MKTDANQRQRSHLPFLDGIRGLAALYVVLYHIYLSLALHGVWQRLPSPFRIGFGWLAYGHLSVSTFIVLSGFCLMLPVVSSGELRGGLGGFALRRARRILPAYYGALLLSIAIILIGYQARRLIGHPNPLLLASLTPASILSHVFLLQNLSPRWIYEIDSPMWSMATEWQIYFVFALVLLPVWRRYGISALVVIGMVLGYGLHFAFPQRVDPACPWYIALFTFGMAAAVAYVANGEARRPWGVFAMAAAAVAFACCLWLRSQVPAYPILDLAVGAMTTFLILALAYSRGAAKPSILVNFLESRWITALGGFSFSVYLTHDPILGAMEYAILLAHPSEIAIVCALFGIALPVCLGIAYVFSLVFERPFLAAAKPSVRLSPPPADPVRRGVERDPVA
jgi:peptidoglycan/LPS O-acetylase OafA/YrhL